MYIEDYGQWVAVNYYNDTGVKFEETLNYSFEEFKASKLNFNKEFDIFLYSNSKRVYNSEVCYVVYTLTIFKEGSSKYFEIFNYNLFKDEITDWFEEEKIRLCTETNK